MIVCMETRLNIEMIAHIFVVDLVEETENASIFVF